MRGGSRVKLGGRIGEGEGRGKGGGHRSWEGLMLPVSTSIMQTCTHVLKAAAKHAFCVEIFAVLGTSHDVPGVCKNEAPSFLHLHTLATKSNNTLVNIISKSNHIGSTPLSPICRTHW
jgi:hypothetical protein